MESLTQLLIAAAALFSAINTLVATINHRKVKKLTKEVNGRMSELINQHRTEAYNEGLSAGLEAKDRRQG